MSFISLQLYLHCVCHSSTSFWGRNSSDRRRPYPIQPFLCHHWRFGCSRPDVQLHFWWFYQGNPCVYLTGFTSVRTPVFNLPSVALTHSCYPFAVALRLIPSPRICYRTANVEPLLCASHASRGFPHTPFHFVHCHLTKWILLSALYKLRYENSG